LFTCWHGSLLELAVQTNWSGGAPIHLRHPPPH